MFTWMPSRRRLGGTDSVVLMVLAVGDQDDRLIGRLVRGKERAAKLMAAPIAVPCVETIDGLIEDKNILAEI